MPDVAQHHRDHRESLLRMITGYQVSQAIYVAARLGIADLLADGPMTSDELASKTGAHARSLYRVLRALSSEGIFREIGTESFEITPVGELLQSGVSHSMRPWAIMFNKEQYDAWGDLLASVQTGDIAFDRVFGATFFSYLSTHPSANDTFNQAMSVSSEHVVSEVLNAYDFAPFATIVDIGGGNGRLLREILTGYPHARGILFDQPHVVDDPRTEHQLKPVAARCEVMGGDFFQEVPAGGDAYILKLIIHDWNDDQCRTILGNCRNRMNQSGKLLLLESILAPDNQRDHKKWMDLHMLALLGGQERHVDRKCPLAWLSLEHGNPASGFGRVRTHDGLENRTGDDPRIRCRSRKGILRRKGWLQRRP